MIATPDTHTPAVPHALPPVPASVVHMLADQARQRPDAAALSFGQVTLTYRQFANAVASVARQWARHVSPRDRIALVLPNSIDLAIALYATHALRCQAVTLNPRYTEHELVLMLSDAAPTLLVHDGASAIGFNAMACLNKTRIVAVDAGHALAASTQSNICLDHAGLPLPTHDDLASLQYTSGTSGRPKGVNIAHRQLAFNIAQREALLPTRAGKEKVLCIMPLFHVSAIAMSLHLACYAGSELIIHPSFDAASALRAIHEQRITVMSGVPTIFRGLLAEPALAHTDFSSLAHCYSGAAPLPATLLDLWEAKTGCVIYEGYGLSEAGPCLTYNPGRGVRKPGSVGMPVPGSELEIVDTETGLHRQTAGTAGEVRVRGPHIMQGYRNRPDLTRKTLRNGWLYTGDIGFVDGDGYLYIKGRQHDAINVGGHTVHPREIEDVLLLHPAVAQAAAFAVDDDYYGESVQAWIVPHPGLHPDAEALIAHCKKKLVGYKVPRAIGLRPHLPVNSTGKLIRAQLEPVKQPNDT